MFDEMKSPPTKRITMTCYEGGNTTEITQEFPADTSWFYIAGQFLLFLRAMGYNVDQEDVSAEF